MKASDHLEFFQGHEVMGCQDIKGKRSAKCHAKKKIKKEWEGGVKGKIKMEKERQADSEHR